MGAIGKIINGEYQEFADDADILAISKEAIEQTPITFEQATELANVQSGDSVSVALGKLSKLYATLESGSASTLLGENLEINKVAVTDANGKIAVSETTAQELGYLSGVTGNVQEQIDKSNANGWMESYAGLTAVGWYRFLEIDISKFGWSATPERFSDMGTSGVVVISRQYNNNNNESYIISFTASSTNGIRWNVLNCSVSDQCLTKLRVTLDEDNKKLYLEVYYSTSVNNFTKIMSKVNTAVQSHISAPNSLTLATEAEAVVNEYTIPKFSDFDLLDDRIKGVKTWRVAEWVAAGGNLPEGHKGYGVIIRTMGYTEPGQVRSNDSYYIFQEYVDSSTVRTWSGIITASGSSTIQWNLLVSANDFSHTDVSVNTVADTNVRIEGVSDNAFQIPIIIGHSATHNCVESVFYQSSSSPSGWMIRSDTAQTTYIRFFSIPK